MDKITTVLGLNIKRLRMDRKMTQSELARKADVSLNFMQNIESGRRWVGTETIAELAQGLGVKECELFGPIAPDAAAADGASRTPAPPDAKEVLMMLCQSLGYDLPEPMMRKLKAARAPSHHFARLPEDIYSHLIVLCQNPDREWDALRKTLVAISANP